mgnify:CR=1 FL=1
MSSAFSGCLKIAEHPSGRFDHAAISSEWAATSGTTAAASGFGSTQQKSTPHAKSEVSIRPGIRKNCPGKYSCALSYLVSCMRTHFASDGVGCLTPNRVEYLCCCKGAAQPCC